MNKNLNIIYFSIQIGLGFKVLIYKGECEKKQCKRQSVKG